MRTRVSFLLAADEEPRHNAAQQSTNDELQMEYLEHNETRLPDGVTDGVQTRAKYERGAAEKHYMDALETHIPTDSRPHTGGVNKVLFVRPSAFLSATNVQSRMSTSRAGDNGRDVAGDGSQVHGEVEDVCDGDDATLWTHTGPSGGRGSEHRTRDIDGLSSRENDGVLDGGHGLTNNNEGGRPVDRYVDRYVDVLSAGRDGCLSRWSFTAQQTPENNSRNGRNRTNNGFPPRGDSLDSRGSETTEGDVLASRPDMNSRSLVDQREDTPIQPNLRHKFKLRMHSDWANDITWCGTLGRTSRRRDGHGINDISGAHISEEFNPSANYVATVSSDRCIYLQELPGFQAEANGGNDAGQDSPDSVESSEYSQKGERRKLRSGGGGSKRGCVAPRTPIFVGRHMDYIKKVSYVPRRNVLYTAGLDGNLSGWDLSLAGSSMAAQSRILSHDYARHAANVVNENNLTCSVYCLSTSSIGNLIATSHANRVINIFDSRILPMNSASMDGSGEKKVSPIVQKWSYKMGHIKDIKLSDSEQSILTATSDGKVLLWSLKMTNEPLEIINIDYDMKRFKQQNRAELRSLSTNKSVTSLSIPLDFDLDDPYNGSWTTNEFPERFYFATHSGHIFGYESNEKNTVTLVGKSQSPLLDLQSVYTDTLFSEGNSKKDSSVHLTSASEYGIFIWEDKRFKGEEPIRAVSSKEELVKVKMNTFDDKATTKRNLIIKIPSLAFPLKTRMLNDQIRCLTVNSDCSMDLWDVTKATKLRTFTPPELKIEMDVISQNVKENKDKYDVLLGLRVIDILETRLDKWIQTKFKVFDWTAPWCKLEPRCSGVMVHLMEKEASLGETYYDVYTKVQDNYDDRFNIGKWVLSNLFNLSLLELQDVVKIFQLRDSSQDDMIASFDEMAMKYMERQQRHLLSPTSSNAWWPNKPNSKTSLTNNKIEVEKEAGTVSVDAKDEKQVKNEEKSDVSTETEPKEDPKEIETKMGDTGSNTNEKLMEVGPSNENKTIEEPSHSNSLFGKLKFRVRKLSGGASSLLSGSSNGNNSNTYSKKNESATRVRSNSAKSLGSVYESENDEEDESCQEQIGSGSKSSSAQNENNEDSQADLSNGTEKKTLPAARRRYSFGKASGINSNGNNTPVKTEANNIQPICELLLKNLHHSIKEGPRFSFKKSQPIYLQVQEGQTSACFTNIFSGTTGTLFLPLPVLAGIATGEIDIYESDDKRPKNLLKEEYLRKIFFEYRPSNLMENLDFNSGEELLVLDYFMPKWVLKWMAQDTPPVPYVRSTFYLRPYIFSENSCPNNPLEIKPTISPLASILRSGESQKSHVVCSAHHNHVCGHMQLTPAQEVSKTNGDVISIDSEQASTYVDASTKSIGDGSENEKTTSNNGNESTFSMANILTKRGRSISQTSSNNNVNSSALSRSTSIYSDGTDGDEIPPIGVNYTCTCKCTCITNGNHDPMSRSRDLPDLYIDTRVNAPYFKEKHDKLTSNRMLRIKKLYPYIGEKMETALDTAKLTEDGRSIYPNGKYSPIRIIINSTAALEKSTSPERKNKLGDRKIFRKLSNNLSPNGPNDKHLSTDEHELILICRDVVLSKNLTLSTVREFIWEAKDDITAIWGSNSRNSDGTKPKGDMELNYLIVPTKKTLEKYGLLGQQQYCNCNCCCCKLNRGDIPLNVTRSGYHMLW